VGLDAVEQARDTRATLVGNQCDMMAPLHQLGRQSVRGDHMAPGTAGRQREVALHAHLLFHRTV
jgi:hypothetical protein